ncbi:hypothetical protein NP493_1344g00055 [Ridgeia piscesae]|uniref:Tetraspanin n=1 Tax=Ridgeia piscesae TaxID=27915 RepID=A0AAD9NDG8_RIDPI|nr:hypothetical protein NP493_1344g00055 [Ridgeia piscesae]
MGLRGCARTLLVIINIVFVVIGGALLGAGIFLKVSSEQTAGLVDEIKANIPDLASGAQIDDAQATASPLLSDDDINDLLNGITMAFIILGLFLFLLGMSGCCGACCAVKTLLIIYVCFVVLVFIAFLAVLIIFATKKVDDSVKSEADKVLQKEYAGIDDFSIKSLTLNYFMITTPVACCKMEGKFPSSTPKDKNCTLVPTDENNNWKTGCNDKVTEALDTYRSPAVGGCAGIMVFQLVCFIMAVYIIKNSEVAPEKA